MGFGDAAKRFIGRSACATRLRTLRRLMRLARVPCCMALIACGGESTPASPAEAIRVLTMPSSDTILALPATPLMVAVVGNVPTPVEFWSDSANAGSSGAPFPRLYFSRSPTFAPFRAADTVLTDSRGHAHIYVRMGFVAGDAVIRIRNLTSGDATSVTVPVKPGAAVRLVVTPADTALYVGRQFVLQAHLADRLSNRTPVPATFESTSPAISLTASGSVTTLRTGRARILVRGGGFETTGGTSVVPAGRIAAVRFRRGPDSTYIALVNLDGSALRTFAAMNAYDLPWPAWHPGGSYLIAARRPLGATHSFPPRLAALDTATGAWLPLRTTPGSLGDGDAQFSRDGHWVYLANAASTQWLAVSGSAIYRFRTDGSGDVEAIGFNADPALVLDSPSPSRDGTRIAKTVTGSLGTFVQVVPAVASQGPAPSQATLVGSAVSGLRPRWSPTRDETLFMSPQGIGISLAGSTSPNERRYLASEFAQQGHATGGFDGASWSPDGRWIVAATSATLIVIDVATGEVMPLPFAAAMPLPFAGGFSRPSWRPN